MPSSQPDHFLLTRQPENARESVETLDPAFSAHLPPHTHLETGDKHTDKGQDWRPALVPGQITRCLMPRREEILFSPLKGKLGKASSMIIPRSCSRAREWEHLCPGLCSGCGSSHSLGEWGHQLESRCLEEALAGRLRREPLATASGDGEPRPGREQG